MKNLKLVVFGNILEWYDFAIYASLAPYLTQIFFPQKERLLSYILTFAIFTAGFIVRPLGGIFFGFISDKFGRSRSMLASLLIMAFPAFLTSLLPTFASIGYSSSIILLIFRVIQGFAIGGEYPALTTFIVEHSPMNKRGLYGSLISVSLSIGVLIATFVILLLTYFLSRSQIISWGWRIPFFISFIFIIISYYIRRSYINKGFFNTNNIQNIYFRNLSKLAIIRSIFYTCCISIDFYLFSTFNITYLHILDRVGYSNQITLFNVISIVIMIAFTFISGLLSDIIGRKTLAYISNVLFLTLSLPIYYMMVDGTFLEIIISQLILAIITGLSLGILPTFLAEQFNKELRATSVAISYNVCVTIFGGTVSLVCVFLMKHLNNVFIPAFYLIITAVLSLVATHFMKDKTNCAL